MKVSWRKNFPAVAEEESTVLLSGLDIDDRLIEYAEANPEGAEESREQCEAEPIHILDSCGGGLDLHDLQHVVAPHKGVRRVVPQLTSEERRVGKEWDHT